jgi:hypothetical protein
MGLPGTREMNTVERRTWADLVWMSDVRDSDVDVDVDRLSVGVNKAVLSPTALPCY